MVSERTNCHRFYSNYDFINYEFCISLFAAKLIKKLNELIVGYFCWLVINFQIDYHTNVLFK